LAGIARRVPIHIEETGWPTGPGRSEARQDQVARLLLQTASDFRGTYNVSDLRWFDLRDHNTSSANFQHHYGLLRDDYSPKPAFATFRDLVASLGPPKRPRPRLRLVVRTSIARAARLRRVPLAIAGADLGLVRRVDWLRSGRGIGRRARAPFPVVVARAAHHRIAVHALVTLADGRSFTLRRALRPVDYRRSM
jgi:hypothetical protein